MIDVLYNYAVIWYDTSPIAIQRLQEIPIMTRQEKLSSAFVRDWAREIPQVETGPQNHYTVNFTDGTSLTAHGDSAPAVFDLWKCRRSNQNRPGRVGLNTATFSLQIWRAILRSSQRFLWVGSAR
jgi:hypothetical protein